MICPPIGVHRAEAVFRRRQVKPTSDERNLGATGGRQIYFIMSIIIESGMISFSIQLARLVVTVVQTDDADYAFQIIVPIHEILTVIITLVISTPYLFFLLAIRA